MNDEVERNESKTVNCVTFDRRVCQYAQRYDIRSFLAYGLTTEAENDSWHQRGPVTYHVMYHVPYLRL